MLTTASADVSAVFKPCFDLKPVLEGVSPGDCVQDRQSETVATPLHAVDLLMSEDCFVHVLIREVAGSDAATAPAKRPFGHAAEYPEAVDPLNFTGAPDGPPDETHEGCVGVPEPREWPISFQGFPPDVSAASMRSTVAASSFAMSSLAGANSQIAAPARGSADTAARIAAVSPCTLIPNGTGE